MDDIRFSITVPIYKVESFLDKCISSVLAQTYPGWELILVNDGSPDGCPAICEKYAQKDSRIKVVNKENGGLVSARKAGAEAASGDYIVCLDGDDWLHEKALEKIHSALKEHGMADLVCFGFFTGNEDSSFPSVWKNRTGYYSKEDIVKEIFPMLIHDTGYGYFAPSAWAKAIKTDLCKSCQSLVDNRIVVGEDAALSLPAVMAAGSMIILEDCLYYYRVNSDSITKNRKPFKWEAPLLIYERLNGSAESLGYDFSDQTDRRLVHDLFNVAVSRFYSGEPYGAVKKEILAHLDGAAAAKAIKSSSFSHSAKAKLMETAMKHRLIFLMYIYSKVK